MGHSKQFFTEKKQQKTAKNTSELAEPVSACQCLPDTDFGALGEPGRYWEHLAVSGRPEAFF